MTTSLEALGAASACLQVISLAAGLVSACKKVYDGRPTANDILEDQVQQMIEAVGRVRARCQTMAGTEASQYDKALEDVAQKCSAAARELQEEVRFVTRLREKGRLLKAINATLRASSHRKRIERLEESLSKYRQAMEMELLSHLW